MQNEFTFGGLIKQWVKKHFKIIADITYNSFVTMEMEGHTPRALHCGIQCLIVCSVVNLHILANMQQ